MSKTLDMYVCLTIVDILNNIYLVSFSLFYHSAFYGLKLVYVSFYKFKNNGNNVQQRKSLYPKLSHGSCTVTKFDWIS